MLLFSILHTSCEASVPLFILCSYVDNHSLPIHHLKMARPVGDTAKKYGVYPPMRSADAHRPLFPITLQQWQLCFSSLSDCWWAVGSVDLPDSFSLGTRLLILGGLWFLLRSFHTWMTHAVPAALYENTDTVVASLFAGISLYLLFSKRSLDTGASVVYFGWILDREQTRTNKEAFSLSHLNIFFFSIMHTQKHSEKSFGLNVWSVGSVVSRSHLMISSLQSTKTHCKSWLIFCICTV